MGCLTLFGLHTDAARGEPPDIGAAEQDRELFERLCALLEVRYYECNHSILGPGLYRRRWGSQLMNKLGWNLDNSRNMYFWSDSVASVCGRVLHIVTNHKYNRIVFWKSTDTTPMDLDCIRVAAGITYSLHVCFIVWLVQGVHYILVRV